MCLMAVLMLNLAKNNLEMNTKTFQEVAIIWSAAKRPIIKHATMCAYMLTLQTHLLPYFGTATAISESDVQKFVLYKLSSGLAKKTVRDIVAVLKSIVKYGGKHKLLPYEEWEINYPTDTESHRLPTLSLNHQQILMSHLTESPTPKNIGNGQNIRSAPDILTAYQP